jgi:ABC-type sugar transport system ATPase subunit
MRRRAAAVLDRLEAEIDPGASLASLSIAQRRLVVIARGLAADARLFVLDEPTASLTDSEIDHLDRVLKSLRDAGVAILYVSHRLDEIFAMTDTVTVMLDGAAVHHGKTADLDKAKLIELITGSVIAVEKRTPHSTPVDAPVLMDVKGMTIPGIVNDAGFQLRKGEMLGLAGLVGAGRTELMRAIFGADRAASGEVWMNGEEVRIRSPRDGLKAGIVLLPEDRKHQGGVLDFSVRKNMTLPSLAKFRVAGPAPFPSERRERKAARELVGRLSIKVADVDYPTRFLSGGNQQKVVLAKWLDSGADVFIFDEPTQGIDVEGKEEVYQLMTALADEGKGVIFVSSEFNELIGTCSRILVMREGELVGQFEGVDISEEELVGACYSHEAEPLAAS